MLEWLRQSHTFFLAGFGCEYSLDPLARHLHDEGFRVVAGDMQMAPLPKAPQGRTVFVTSQHPARSSFVFRNDYDHTAPFSNYVGPLEIIRHLRPDCSVFVPHDLETPIVADELAYMPAFDLYCAPDASAFPGLGRSCRVVPAGWIKHNHFDDIPEDVKAQVADAGVCLLNQISRLLRDGGAPFVERAYPQILEAQIPIKLPSWPGCQELGEQLGRRGARILASDLCSTKLIAASSRLHVNAPGSVVAEARYLGVAAHLLKEGRRESQVLVPDGCRASAPRFDFPRLLQAIAEHIEKTQ